MLDPGRISRSESSGLNPHLTASACVYLSRISPGAWNPGFRHAHSLPIPLWGHVPSTSILFTPKGTPRALCHPTCPELSRSHSQHLEHEPSPLLQPSRGTLWLGQHRAPRFLCGFPQNVTVSVGEVDLEDLGCLGQRFAHDEGNSERPVPSLVLMAYWFLLALECWGEGWGVVLLSSYSNLVSFPNIAS